MLDLFSPLRLFQYAGVAHELRLSMFPKEMKIDRVEDDAALRRMQRNSVEALSGKIAPAEYDYVETRTMHVQVVADSSRIRIMAYFDTACLDVGPGRSLGPAGRTVIVNYFAAWLVKDAIATVAHLEAEIGIFVVSGRVARIEFANALEQRFGNHQCRG